MTEVLAKWRRRCDEVAHDRPRRYERVYAWRVVWRPLSARNDPERSKAYDALHEGVPEWLATPVAQWIYETFDSMRYEGDLRHTLDLLYGILRRPMPSGRFDDLIEDLASAVAQGDLDILDAMVWLTGTYTGGWKQRDRLSLMLAVHGSAWCIGTDDTDQPCLQRRVNEAAAAAARAEMERTGNAATHLHRAWHRVYGRSPDAGGAYREAVRAVEAAAKPVVLPSDTGATLGKMIAAMKAKPEKWTVVLDGNGRGSGMAHLISMCQSIWTSQLDRHGTDDERVPLDVSPREAEAALHLAVTLVHWFRSEAVQVA